MSLVVFSRIIDHTDLHDIYWKKRLKGTRERSGFSLKRFYALSAL